MKNIRKQYIQGVSAVLLSAMCFALTSVLFKTAFSYELGPFEILALQSWIASFFLLIYNLLFNRGAFRIPKRTILVLAFQGIAGSLGTSIFYAYALIDLPASVATLLLYLYPVLVLASGVLWLKKKLHFKEILALLLTLAGTTIASGIFLGIEAVSRMGVIFGLASAVAYAIFNVVGEVALQKVQPLTAMSYSQWFSTLGLLLYFRGDITRIPWGSPEVLIIGFMLATVASIFPFYLILVGIKKIGSDQAAILSTFELPVTFLMAAIFLNEIPNMLQIAGGGLVLFGIILLNWRNKYEREQSVESIYPQRAD